MLEKLDGVMLAVRDADVAAERFGALFDTKVLGTEKSDALNAGLTELACGVDIIRLAVPLGPGPIDDHLDRWGEGIVGSVFAAKDPEAVAERVQSKGVDVTTDNILTLLDPEKTHGLLTARSFSVPSGSMRLITVPCLLSTSTVRPMHWRGTVEP
jgi:hypothetical protein